ncbi:glycerol kinase GlpK [SAR116 cluster bacterium]|nr:glycerol kinase GlpK [SAR116 cluster bacterium]
MDTYISIDQGTTSSRAILFGEDGSILKTCQMEFEQIYPKPGWVEHNPEEIWETTKSVLKDLYHSNITKKHKIRGIGITNQRETTILWDKKSGKPLYNAIVWQDRRTSDFCKSLIKQGLEETVMNKSGLVIDPYFSATKIKWILDNVPGARSKAENDEICFGTVDSFLLWKLTGGKVHATDATNASRTSLYNIESLEWDNELLKIFDVPKSLMPVVMDSNSHFGDILKDIINVELPILSILGDQQAAAVGQACFKPGSIKSTYGTGCFVIINSGKKIIKSNSRLLGTICYKINGEVTYALEGSIFIAGAVVQWLRDSLKIIETASQTEDIIEKMQSNSGVYLVPAFTGLGCPYWDPDARGAIYGITRDTGKNEITRAAIESVAYQTRDLFKAMSEDGISPKMLRVDGGMTDNSWLMQFLSNIVDISVEVPKITETTALGVAMMAALTDGKYSTLEELSNLWSSDKSYIPIIEKSERDNLLKNWDYYVNKTLT